MKIETHEDNTGYAPRSCRYSAVDADTYDGAPDSRNRWHVGYGATPDEAEADLLRLLTEIAEDEDERQHESLPPAEAGELDPDRLREDRDERRSLL